MVCPASGFAVLYIPVHMDLHTDMHTDLYMDLHTKCHASMHVIVFIDVHAHEPVNTLVLGTPQYVMLSLFSNDAMDKEWADNLERLLLEKPGVGTRCMDKDIYSIE